MNIIEKAKKWHYNLRRTREKKEREKNAALYNEINELNSLLMQVHTLLTSEEFNLEIMSTAKQLIDNLKEKSAITKNKVTTKTKNDENKERTFFIGSLLLTIYGSFFIIHFNRLLIIPIYFIIQYIMKALTNHSTKALTNIEKERKEIDEIIKVIGYKEELLIRKTIKYALPKSEKKSLTKEKVDELTPTYIQANQIIINYIDGFAINIADIDPAMQEVILGILKFDLQSDSNNLQELLDMAKTKVNASKDLDRERKH